MHLDICPGVHTHIQLQKMRELTPVKIQLSYVLRSMHIYIFNVAQSHLL